MLKVIVTMPATVPRDQELIIGAPCIPQYGTEGALTLSLYHVSRAGRVVERRTSRAAVELLRWEAALCLAGFLNKRVQGTSASMKDELVVSMSLRREPSWLFSGPIY